MIDEGLSVDSGTCNNLNTRDDAYLVLLGQIMRMGFGQCWEKMPTKTKNVANRTHW